MVVVVGGKERGYLKKFWEKKEEREFRRVSSGMGFSQF